MPLYVYQVIEADGGEGDTFEYLQGMNEPPLEKHPDSGKPVKRILHLPNAAGKNSDMAIKDKLSPKNLERLGLTQYKKSGGGTYEKTAGQGPNVISGD